MDCDPSTIYALSSAAGRAGVAVVRISGPAAIPTLQTLVPGLQIRPRHAHFVTLIDPATESMIDQGLAMAFPGPASFSGEDVVELQVHGSPAVLERLFGVLSSLGLTAAGRGDFTRRAFANGKMDLTEAEGLADLIAADSEAQRVQALKQIGGAWSERVADWHVRLLDALAWLEASIDFSDEDDVPDDVAAGSTALLRGVAGEIRTVLGAGHAGEIIRDGLRVAIIGAPNVGKSTLLNRLAGREAAIVSDIPGTTRDVVEVRLQLAGYVVILADTAGLRETQDQLEAEGIRRTRMRAEEADLRLFVRDARAAGDGALEMLLHREGDLVILNKADLLDGRPDGEGYWISAATGDGIEQVLQVVQERLLVRVAGQEGVLITRQRHRQALEVAAAALDRALLQTADLAAEDVRVALQALARIVGRFDVEDVLDRVFSAFCIGK